MTEKLANLSWQYVLLIVATLLVVRFSLIRVDNDAARFIAETAESLAVAFALVFFLIRPFLIQAFFIPSGSMHPTLLEDDHIIVNKLGYRFRPPQTGDVVVFKAPPEASDDGVERDFIKRLIGTPGDTVEVRSGSLLVGGHRLGRQDVREKFISAADIGKEVSVKYLPDGVLLAGRKIPTKEIATAFGAPADEVRIRPGQTLLNGKPMDDPYTAEDPDYDMPRVKLEPQQLFVMGDNRNNSRDSHLWGPLQRQRLIGKAMFIFYPFSRIRIVH